MNAANPERDTILIGIGNDGRTDDGLGWRFVEALQDTPGIDVEFRYQLQVEDAECIAGYRRAVFVDAAREPLPGGFVIRKCAPAQNFYFSTHRLEPEAIAWLAAGVYGAKTECYLVAVSGLQWDLHCGLTPEAGGNLRRALAAFREGHW